MIGSSVLIVEVGGIDEDTPGAFLQGMLDYVDDAPLSRDEVLAAIDAAWPKDGSPWSGGSRIPIMVREPRLPGPPAVP